MNSKVTVSSLCHGTNVCTSDGNATANATATCRKLLRLHAGQLAMRSARTASFPLIGLSANLTRCNAHSNATPAAGHSQHHLRSEFLNLTEILQDIFVVEGDHAYL